MLRADRSKAARLENILARHKAFEARTLADLHTAGFTFKTVTAAYQRLSAQQTLQGFTQRQIDIAIDVETRRLNKLPVAFVTGQTNTETRKV